MFHFRPIVSEPVAVISTAVSGFGTVFLVRIMQD